MKPIIRKTNNRPAVRSAARPPAAVELSSRGAVAATGTPPVYGHASLAAGALRPGVADVNLPLPDAVTAALREALDAVRPPKRVVTLVVPDPCVRVFVLDFDTLPGKAAEVRSILRFRLRKMVPFDVEQAGISYQVLAQARHDCRVLVAVVPGAVQAEYEAVVRAAGYEPGALLSATLAALENLQSKEPELVVHVAEEGLTTAIVAGDDLTLYRWLELPSPTEEPLRTSLIERGIGVAMAYFEDKTGAAPTRIHCFGELSAEDLAGLHSLAGVRAVELVADPTTGAATALGNASVAAATGALKGAGL